MWMRLRIYDIRFGYLSRILFCMLLIANVGGAQNSSGITGLNVSSQYQDTTNVVLRFPDKSKIDAFLSDEEFIYDPQPGGTIGFLNQIMAWIFQKIFVPALSERFAVFWKIFAYMLIAGAVVFLIIHRMNINIRGIFHKAGKQMESDFLASETEINEIDFDQLIRQYTRDRQFRMAVRLLYLKTLKCLADKKFIRWRKDKTNRDYLHEIGDTQVRIFFERTTRLYEYAWYGDFDVDSGKFQLIRKTFQDFLKEAVGIS